MQHGAAILVVDDDVATRRLLTAALSSEPGFHVVAVKHPEEAIKKIESGERFHIVIGELPRATNCNMIDIIRHINGHIPYLVLSSMQTDESVARALQYGADDYLQKPVDLKELRRTVTMLLARHAPQDNNGTAIISPHETSRIHKSSSVRSLGDGTFVELTAPTDPNQAERFQRFAERLLSASLNEKERHNMHLALEEILRNAIEWGNRHDQSKKLKLSYCLLPDRITFRIEDEGQGFDHSKLRDPSLDPAKHILERRASGKRMGGWGVFLTRKMMDEVQYNTKGNVVYLTKYLRRNPDDQDDSDLREAVKVPETLPGKIVQRRRSATTSVTRRKPAVSEPRS
ncbi:MAG TPA: ATP-binding protein [Planctomycetota bacterium]|nr:ATP-binding protein [Planctomycetota bacterium]